MKIDRGININCKLIDFLELILNGIKIIETRDSNSLRSCLGKRVALIKTGVGKAMVVGYATINPEVIIYNKETFHNDYINHRVPKGSEYDIKEIKYGYILENVERCIPYHAPKGGRVIRILS